MRLEEEWAALDAQKAALGRLEVELAARTPGDVARSSSKRPTVQLAPKYVWGAFIGVFSVVSAAIAMYWKADTHMSDGRIHILEETGVPVAVERRYETAVEAKEARTVLIHDIEDKMATQHETLKEDLVKAIAPPARYRQWKRAEDRKRRSASAGRTTPPG